jgi:hypothetical protein
MYTGNVGKGEDGTRPSLGLGLGLGFDVVGESPRSLWGGVCFFAAFWIRYSARSRSTYLPR